MNKEANKLQTIITLFSWFAYMFVFGFLLLLSVFQVVAARKWYKRVYAATITSTLIYSLVWSGVFVSFVLNLLLIGARGLYILEINEAKTYVKFIGYTLVMIITQLAAVLAVDMKCKDFPIPLVIHYSFFGWIFPQQSNVIIQGLVMWNIFVFVQQIVFHSFFLILALHSQPIGTASMLVIYVIFLFTLVSLVAFLMQLAQFIKHVICKQEIKKLKKNIKRLVSAVTAGIVLMCLMIIWTVFTLISSEFSADATRLTHPVIASLFLSMSYWFGNNMIRTYWIGHASQHCDNNCHNDETEMTNTYASMTVPLIEHESEIYHRTITNIL